VNQHAQRESLRVVVPQRGTTKGDHNPQGLPPQHAQRESLRVVVRGRAETRWHCEPSHEQCKSDGSLLTVACGQVAPAVPRLKALSAAPWPEVHRVTAARGSACDSHKLSSSLPPPSLTSFLFMPHSDFSTTSPPPSLRSL